jgi:TonB family protein
MNTAHSTARPVYEYQPTIIETRPLISRLMVQLAFLRDELRRTWTEFKTNPRAFTIATARQRFLDLRRLLTTPYVAPALLSAIVLIMSLFIAVPVLEKRIQRVDVLTGEEPELTFIDLSRPLDSNEDWRIGRNGIGRVGFRDGVGGEGSAHSPRPAGGGGGGGSHNPLPPQYGKLPPPSTIRAAIPTAPPINPPALPVAGMDIDPALWNDLKAPVYGDPRSISTAESKGPGEGEGIGWSRGTGIGEGDGPGFGPGKDGNIGDGPRQLGCCGFGGGNSGGRAGTYSSSEVEQRARLLFKPEPQYTEEARKNQITGTVMLRVVFSSGGEVVQIRAVRTLPFGLTEQAIAAARQIRFVPAMKDGRAVSVFMQLEYNFNLY